MPSGFSAEKRDSLIAGHSSHLMTDDGTTLEIYRYTLWPDSAPSHTQIVVFLSTEVDAGYGKSDSNIKNKNMANCSN
ncbi:Uncharacterised protein [Budvicia aquatica]|uniref:Uncharacterized protein n=1 Tax=Budvicia aquatica TaxID=82979 RepID=A0A484ZG82_9GAMM|nr:Uncharacterised protein [Budvicia aquatica]